MTSLRSILYLFVLLNSLLLFSTSVLYSQYNNATESYKQEEIQGSKLNQDKWKSLSKRYDYSIEEEKKERKPKEKPKSEFKPGEKNVNPANTLASEALKYLLFTIIILILAYIIIRLIAGGSIFKNKKLPKEKVYTIDDIEENLHEVNVETFLSDALVKEDFRLAIRLYYLSILKGLSLNGRIRWKKDKTNGMYLREMYNHSSVADFRKVTYIYEYVWFNEEEPFNASDFERVRPDFKNMLRIAEKVEKTTAIA